VHVHVLDLVLGAALYAPPKLIALQCLDEVAFALDDLDGRARARRINEAELWC
jgi:hypothetical protein